MHARWCGKEVLVTVAALAFLLASPAHAADADAARMHATPFQSTARAGDSVNLDIAISGFLDIPREVLLVADEPRGVATFRWSPNASATLASGGAPISRTLRVTLAGDASPGVVRIAFHLDDALEPVRLATAEAEILVVDGPQAVVSFERLFPSRMEWPTAGGTLPFVVRNDGATEATIRLSILPAGAAVEWPVQESTWLVPAGARVRIEPPFTLHAADDRVAPRIAVSAEVTGPVAMSRTFGATLVPRAESVPTSGASPLHVAVAPNPLRVAPGSEAAATLTLRNTGDQPLFVGIDPAAKDGLVVRLDQTSAFLDAGASRTLPLRVMASADAIEGERRVALRFGGVTPAPQDVVIVVLVTTDAPPPDGTVKRAAFAAGLFGVASLAAGLALRRETWRYTILAALAPLYTRFAPNELLDNATREQINTLVSREPGISYGELKAATGLNTGALIHHLRALERGRLIATRKEGTSRRFFAPGAVPRTTHTGPSLTPTQRTVLAHLADGPLTQPELARRLGVTQQGANHHVKTLERRGLVNVARTPQGTLVSVVDEASGIHGR